MRFNLPVQMTIPARLMLASWLVTLVGLVVLAFSPQGQRPAHLALKMAPARQYALKMAPARQVLLAGSPGVKSKVGLISS